MNETCWGMSRGPLQSVDLRSPGLQVRLLHLRVDSRGFAPVFRPRLLLLLRAFAEILVQGVVETFGSHRLPAFAPLAFAFPFGLFPLLARFLGGFGLLLGRLVGEVVSEGLVKGLSVRGLVLIFSALLAFPLALSLAFAARLPIVPAVPAVPALALALALALAPPLSGTAPP